MARDSGKIKIYNHQTDATVVTVNRKDKNNLQWQNDLEMSVKVIY